MSIHVKKDSSGQRIFLKVGEKSVDETVDSKAQKTGIRIARWYHRLLGRSISLNLGGVCVNVVKASLDKFLDRTTRKKSIGVLSENEKFASIRRAFTEITRSESNESGKRGSLLLKHAAAYHFRLSPALRDLSADDESENSYRSLFEKESLLQYTDHLLIGNLFMREHLKKLLPEIYPEEDFAKYPDRLLERCNDSMIKGIYFRLLYYREFEKNNNLKDFTGLQADLLETRLEKARLLGSEWQKGHLLDSRAESFLLKDHEYTKETDTRELSRILTELGEYGDILVSSDDKECLNGLRAILERYIAGRKAMEEIAGSDDYADFDEQRAEERILSGKDFLRNWTEFQKDPSRTDCFNALQESYSKKHPEDRPVSELFIDIIDQIRIVRDLENILQNRDENFEEIFRTKCAILRELDPEILPEDLFGEFTKKTEETQPSASSRPKKILKKLTDFKKLTDRLTHKKQSSSPRDTAPASPEKQREILQEILACLIVRGNEESEHLKQQTENWGEKKKRSEILSSLRKENNALLERFPPNMHLLSLTKALGKIAKKENEILKQIDEIIENKDLKETNTRLCEEFSYYIHQNFATTDIASLEKIKEYNGLFLKKILYPESLESPPPLPNDLFDHPALLTKFLSFDSQEETDEGIFINRKRESDVTSLLSRDSGERSLSGLQETSFGLPSNAGEVPLVDVKVFVKTVASYFRRPGLEELSFDGPVLFSVALAEHPLFKDEDILRMLNPEKMRQYLTDHQKELNLALQYEIFTPEQIAAWILSHATKKMNRKKMEQLVEEKGYFKKHYERKELKQNSAAQQIFGYFKEILTLFPEEIAPRKEALQKFLTFIERQRHYCDREKISSFIAMHKEALQTSMTFGSLTQEQALVQSCIAGLPIDKDSSEEFLAAGFSEKDILPLSEPSWFSILHDPVSDFLKDPLQNRLPSSETWSTNIALIHELLGRAENIESIRQAFEDEIRKLQDMNYQILLPIAKNYPGSSILHKIFAGLIRPSFDWEKNSFFDFLQCPDNINISEEQALLYRLVIRNEHFQEILRTETKKKFGEFSFFFNLMHPVISAHLEAKEQHVDNSKITVYKKRILALKHLEETGYIKKNIRFYLKRCIGPTFSVNEEFERILNVFNHPSDKSSDSLSPERKHIYRLLAEKLSKNIHVPESLEVAFQDFLFFLKNPSSDFLQKRIKLLPEPVLKTNEEELRLLRVLLETYGEKAIMEQLRIPVEEGLNGGTAEEIAETIKKYNCKDPAVPLLMSLKCFVSKESHLPTLRRLCANGFRKHGFSCHEHVLQFAFPESSE